MPAVRQASPGVKHRQKDKGGKKLPQGCGALGAYNRKQVLAE
jgi:hypothetical protein